jgi:hypothetical protein
MQPINSLEYLGEQMSKYHENIMKSAKKYGKTDIQVEEKGK